MNQEKNKELFQKKYLDLQLLINQITQIQQQILNIQQQVLELKNLKDGLEGFKNIKNDSNAYVPLGSNIFAKANLIENKELLVGVGANVLVKKTAEETISLVNEQIVELEKIALELEVQINEMDLKGQELQEELSNLQK